VRANDGAMGQCLAGVEDATGGMVIGRLALAQALMREAITPAGTNIVDPLYGGDVTDLLYGRVDAATISEKSTRLTGRWRADDRVRDAQVNMSLVNGVLIIAGTVWDKDGPFPLTISVSDAGAQLLGKVA
jgi:phage baseplate assembly protein W